MGEIFRVDQSPELPIEVEDELGRLRDRFLKYANAGTADSTKKVYKRCWASFEAWCRTKNLTALPARAETVAWYAVVLVSGEAGRAHPLKVNTILMELASITHQHVKHGFAPPTRDPHLRLILRGMRREHGMHVRGAYPLFPDQIRYMARHALAHSRDPLRRARDLAVLTFGFASALRRSEFAGKLGIVRRNLTFRKGLRGWECEIELEHSKGDQEGRHQTCVVHASGDVETCPVKAMETWLDAAQIKDGPVLRQITDSGALCSGALNERALDDIVRRYVRRVQKQSPGCIPDNKTYSAHSLRSGCATSMAAANKSPFEIREHLRHKSLVSTMKYVRLAETIGSTATLGIGI